MVTAAPIAVDGNMTGWSTADRIDSGLGAGYAIYARSSGTDFVFAIQAPGVIGANTTAWFNTDRNTATGHQIFGFAGGAEYNVNIDAAGIVSLFSGGAGQTLLKAGLTAAWSADRTFLEFAVPKAAIGNPLAIDTMFDVNDSVFLPGSYSAPGFTVFNDTGIVPAADHRIAIVWSETTAKAYFSQTAYSQLFMAAQSQAMQAGVPFDIIQESDLTSLTTLAKYDTIVFPSFRNVKVDQVEAITAALQQATKQFGIGLIAGGEFMTNAADGSALAGDSYARMKLLFDATRLTGGSGDVTVKASDTSLVLDGYDAGQLIHQYTGVGWNAFTSVSGTGTTIATETVGGQTYAAAIATQTGGRNVVFSTEAVMADENLLQKAIDYSVNGSGLSVGLQMTRNTGMVAARVDMDQSQEKIEVNPDGTTPGIYDIMLPILAQWKAAYNFVGSYYVNTGNDVAGGQTTDWAVSLPYYKQLIDMGNELGLHSYTHPVDTNLLTPAQIAFEFGEERKLLEQKVGAYLGTTVSLGGAAVPGAPETIATSQEILKHVTYLSGGYSGVGAGYPNAFGFMTPANAVDGKVYLAPNTVFDFTLMEFQRKTVAEAEAIWAKEFNQLTAEADAPVVVWPWHDYGPAMWSTGGASPYVTSMFTNWIARAASAGMEFVTLADLAERISGFQKSTFSSSVSGNVISASVSASTTTGEFALDIDGQGSQVIKNVAGWYAYSADKVFLPQAGGNFTITIGAVADDVTHITALPMRGTLLSVTGDGRNLAFSVLGEGKVVVDIQAPGSNWTKVTGATIASISGELLTLDIGANGRHDVTVGFVANLAPVITSFAGGATGTIAIAENGTAVGTITATDANAALGDSVRYSIAATGDGARFTIDAATGALRFVAAPDFEAPTDANRDNAYSVTVVATDARGATDTQALTVTVTDVVGITRTGSLFSETMTGTGEQDVLDGSWGNDVINGLGGNDTLIGGLGRDTLNGGDGNDILDGGNDNDILVGGNGDDILIGGDDGDTMTGGAGADIFRLLAAGDSARSGSDRDTITDFQRGVDRIDLSAIDAINSASGNQSFTLRSGAGASFTGAGQLRFAFETINGVAHTVVYGNTNSGNSADFSIALVGRHDLTVADFIL